MTSGLTERLPGIQEQTVIPNNNEETPGTLQTAEGERKVTNMSSKEKLIFGCIVLGMIGIIVGAILLCMKYPGDGHPAH